MHIGSSVVVKGIFITRILSRLWVFKTSQAMQDSPKFKHIHSYAFLYQAAQGQSHQIEYNSKGAALVTC